MRFRLTLQQLDAIVKLARHGSFRDAALASGVSQPAFSRTIRIIETRLAARLFDRDTHRVSLTPAGQKLLPMAIAMLRDHESSFREFEEFVTGHTGTIRIAVLPSVAGTFLPRTMAAFAASNPTVRFELWEDVGTPVHRAVKEGQADFGIAPPPHDDDLAFKLLLQDELMLVARRGDPLLKSTENDWAVFAQRPSIALSLETGLRALVDEALATAQVQAEPLFVCKQPATLVAFVAQGVGIAALTRLTLAQVASTSVGSTRLCNPVSARPIGVVTHVRRSPSPAARLFLKELQVQAQHFQATGFASS